VVLYNLVFDVSKDTASPHGGSKEPLRGGVYGDKGQASVTFNLLEGVPMGGGYRYRVEIVDGAGGYDVTELMPAEEGKVVIDIPTSWTVPGIAALRLVAVETDADGNEEARFHSLPMRVYFDDRNDGKPVEAMAETVWQSFLTKSEKYVDEARLSAEQSATAATEAQSAAEAAEKSAETAAEDAAEGARKYVNEAAQIKADCENILGQVEELTGITATIKRVVGV
jgi:hypothetical protein